MKPSSLIKGWIAFAYFLFPAAVSAQGDGDEVQREAKHQISFLEFVERVESSSKYHFYYKPEEVDTLSLVWDPYPDSIPLLLEKAFENSSFNYSIAPGKLVFVTSGWKIRPHLSPGFFDPPSEEKNKRQQASEVKDTPDLVVVDYFADRQAKVDDGEVKVIGKRSNFIRKGESIITGRVSLGRNGEPVVGASIVPEIKALATTTDPFGYFSLKIPNGRHSIEVSSLGMRSVHYELLVYSDGNLEIEMEEAIQSLQEVVVNAERNANVTRTAMGIEDLTVKDIEQIPSALGEVDVIKAVLTLPGVKSVGEASAGFNVRGGSADQNLILYNNATIYNPSHLFGFFSSFNPDVLKDVQLFKGSIPASHGGRLASVLKVTSREGNKKEFSGSGGIGLVTGRLTLEGPLVKDKTSIILGARSNYSNWLLKKLENETYRNSRAQFYDLDLGLSHQINQKNNLYLNAYHSNDFFRFKADTSYNYQNNLLSLRWKRLFSDKLVANFGASYSGYNYSINSSSNPETAFDLDFAIDQYNLNADFNYFLNVRHSLSWGISSSFYKLAPGSLLPTTEESIVKAKLLQQEQALESAVYLGDEFAISSNLVLNAGVRFSLFNYLGPRSVLEYDPSIAKSPFSVKDSLDYSPYENIKTYGGPELRASLRYRLGQSSAVKLSYNSLRQYIHMLSNTTAISPTDIWKLSDNNIRPQYGQQVSLGYYHNFANGAVEASLEVYAKTFEHYLDYRSGAQLIMNPFIERDVINSIGRAYGAEFLLKKKSGKLNGWLSYTYSRSLLKQDDPLIPEQVNGGEWYPSNFDKPQDLTIVGNYRFTHRYSFSLNFTYSTGRPITLPVGKYIYDGAERVVYSDRNEYRIPDYYRLDIGLNIEGNHRVNKPWHSSWSFGVYNLLGRKNPYSVYFTSRNGSIAGYKLSIFGRAIPTITYNFRF